MEIVTTADVLSLLNERDIAELRSPQFAIKHSMISRRRRPGRKTFGRPFPFVSGTPEVPEIWGASLWREVGGTTARAEATLRTFESAFDSSIVRFPLQRGGLYVVDLRRCVHWRVSPAFRTRFDPDDGLTGIFCGGALIPDEIR